MERAWFEHGDCIVGMVTAALEYFKEKNLSVYYIIHITIKVQIFMCWGGGRQIWFISGGVRDYFWLCA